MYPDFDSQMDDQPTWVVPQQHMPHQKPMHEVVLGVDVEDQLSSSQGHSQSVMMFSFDQGNADQAYARNVNEFEQMDHRPQMVDEGNLYPALSKDN